MFLILSSLRYTYLFRQGNMNPPKASYTQAIPTRKQEYNLILPIDGLGAWFIFRKPILLACI